VTQQVINILVAAGGIIVAAAVIAAVRGAFKVAGAIRDNTEAVTKLSADLTAYIHENDTAAALMRQDIQQLKDWRLQVEATTRHIALGGTAP